MKNKYLPVSLALAAAVTLVSSAGAGSLPNATGEKATLSGRLTPAGDVDTFGLDLLPGDQVVFKVKDSGPEFGLQSTLQLLDPDGIDTLVEVKRQSSPRPSFKFTAEKTGTHAVSISGDPGGFAGATGNYSVKTKIKRANPGAVKLAAQGGGAFVIPVGITADALLTMKLTVKKGGADIAGLFRPDGTPEPGFVTGLKTKGRTRYQAKSFRVSGGLGTYELRGSYDPGAKAKVKISLTHTAGKVKGSLSDLEPRFDPFLAPFPDEGVPGVTVITVVGQNLTNTTSGDTVTFPTITMGATGSVGTITIDPAVIENPLGQVYRFPAPDALVEGATYSISVRNADGQGDIAENAFTHVPPATIFGLSETEAGPAGGRRLRVVGQNIRAGSTLLVDGIAVNPDFVIPTRLDFVAPAHVAGTAPVVVRDEFGRSVSSPDSLTYLDVPSNRIDDVTPARLQGIGGETVTVDGADFSDDTTLTFGGAPVSATLESATRMTFRAPPRASGVIAVAVEDSLEQSSTFDVTVAAFDDVSSTRIPTPNSGAGVADGWRATRVLVGRIDGDAIDDLVLVRPAAAFGSDASRSRVRVLLADGSGGYTDATSGIPAVSATDDWRAVDAALADVDGQNGLDILLLTSVAMDGGNRSSLRVLLNDGTGTFTDGTGTSMPGETSWGDHNQGFALVVADFDGQNGVDVAIVHNQSFEETIDLTPPVTDPLEPPPEQVLVTTYYAGTRVLLNDGTGIFSRDLDALPGLDADSVERFTGTTIAAIDIDGANGPDVVLSGNDIREDAGSPGTYLRRAVMLVNDGTGAFDDDSASRLPTPTSADYLHGDRTFFTDYDANGTQDLVIASDTRLVAPGSGVASSDPALRIYSNDGTGNFSRLPVGTLVALSDSDSLQCSSVAFGDLSGDGRPDIVLVSARAPRSGGAAARVLVWTGSGFSDGTGGLPHPVVVDDGRGGDVRLHDVDGDGDLDILIGRDDPDETVRNTRVLDNPRIE